MTVQGIALVDLPPASARAAATTRALARCLGSLGHWPGPDPLAKTVSLRGVGTVVIALAGVGDSASPAAPEDVVFGLERVGRWGRILIDAELALRVVSATLGRAQGPSLRSLGRAERGVLAAQVASVLRDLGSDVRISLATPAASRLHDSATILLSVEVKGENIGMNARARLDVPLTWLDGPVDRPVTGPLAEIGPVASTLTTVSILELASTTLTGEAWLAVRPGDAVVFDGVASPVVSGSWETRLCVGHHAARCHLNVDGTLRVFDGFRPLAKPLSEEKEHPMPVTPARDLEPAVETTAVLAAAPIEVVAEIGRMILRGDEVMGLGPGSVLAFGGARTASVGLRVGDAIWARGELVDVDGELGVRITEITRASTTTR